MDCPIYRHTNRPMNTCLNNLTGMYTNKHVDIYTDGHMNGHTLTEMCTSTQTDTRIDGHTCTEMADSEK